jgi:glycosyltransferase involved in cell wall biosynthesis
LVLSSRYETVAIVIAEAMSCGLPVIATAVNGAREVLQAGDSPAAGDVVEVGDMSALLAAAARLVTSPPDLVAMAVAGRARAERLFTAESVVDRLDAAYRVAMQSRATTRLRPSNRVGIT